MPLRDEPSGQAPGLSRKPSLSHFTGLPAPSPFRKSLRAPGDTSAAAGPSVAGPAPLSKRSSVSWLSKARETKALETTGKRASTFNTTKRKSSEMLETANAVLRALEEERAAKMPKLSGSSVEMTVDSKESHHTAGPSTVSNLLIMLYSS